jgi:hypothetical protein
MTTDAAIIQAALALLEPCFATPIPSACGEPLTGTQLLIVTRLTCAAQLPSRATATLATRLANHALDALAHSRCLDDLHTLDPRIPPLHPILTDAIALYHRSRTV